MAQGPRNPAKEALARIASEVATQERLNVVLAPQQDVTFTVKSALVHPVQLLENSYQRVIQEAGRREPDASRRQAAERKALGRYFPFHAGELYFMGPDGAEPGAVDTSFATARANLKAVRELAAEEAADPSAVDEAKTVCAAAVESFRAIVGEYHEIGKALSHDVGSIPLIREIETLLGSLPAELTAASDWRKLGSICNGTLRRLTSLMSELTRGAASVQVFHVIDTFYLYRLLVRYQIKSNDEITATQPLVASSGLTDLLNNDRSKGDRDWLLDWLKAKMREIDVAMARIGNLHFHLKGGRALEYVRLQPQDGRNDWDTSVLIDPDLSADAWYAKFTEVHNELVGLLQRFKREFFVLAHKHAQELEESLDAGHVEPSETEETSDENLYDDAVSHFEGLELQSGHEDDGTSSGGTEKILFPKYSAACKAELIDVGIARRDTVEAQAHWHHIGPGIIRKPWTDGIPVPGHRYYIDEYLLMLREALEGPSVKIEKRISRLASFLGLEAPMGEGEESIDGMADAARARVVDSGFAKTLTVVDEQGLAIRRLLYVMLDAIGAAYDLGRRPALLDIVDGLVAKQVAEPLERENLLKNLPDHIKAALPALKPEQIEVLGWIALMHGITREIEDHLRQKAIGFGFEAENADGVVADEAEKRRAAIVGLLRWLQSEAAFRPEDQLEVQLAVTGSLAASLHVDYVQNRLPTGLVDQIRKQMDPVEMVDVKVFCLPRSDRQLDPGTVLSAMIRPLLEEYADKKPPFTFEYHQEHVDVVWKEPVHIGGFEYKPMVARISVVQKGWPLLSYVWGLPVLSLPDLVREYFTRASGSIDFLAERRLNRSAALLASVLTYFEANDAVDPDRDQHPPKVDVDGVIDDIRKVARVGNSANRSERLREIAAETPYDQRIASEIVMACADLASPKHKSVVIGALLSRSDVSTEGYLTLAAAIEALQNGAEASTLLQRFAADAPITERVLKAMLQAASTITTSSNLTKVLLALASRRGLNLDHKRAVAAFANEYVTMTKDRTAVLTALGFSN